MSNIEQINWEDDFHTILLNFKRIHKLTYPQIAEILGVSLQAVSRWGFGENCRFPKPLIAQMKAYHKRANKGAWHFRRIAKQYKGASKT